MTSNNSSSINNPDSFDQDDKEARIRETIQNLRDYDELVGLSGGASDGNGEDSSDNGDMARIGRSGNNGNNNSNKKSFVDKERKRIYVKKIQYRHPIIRSSDSRRISFLSSAQKWRTGLNSQNRVK